MPRRIAVLTTGRQDYGILRSTIHALRDSPKFELLLYVGGMHLEERYGHTSELIVEDGVPDFRRLPFLSEHPSPSHDVARAMEAVAVALSEDRPDALLVVGDRSETMAAAIAASVLCIPIIHLHGGEETEGAIDNAFRHALTKLSHLHLTSHEDHAARVTQMGEPADRVHVVGPPGLDNLAREDLPSRDEILGQIGLSDPAPGALVVVTIHATTLSREEPLAETRAVAEALDAQAVGVIVTMPNSDAGGDVIRDFWNEWAQGRSNVALVDALGERVYWGLLASADAMVSNSSSGLIEAPAALLPVINVGERQKGRLRHAMTVDVAADPGAVRQALSTVTEPMFRDRLRSSPPLYPGGRAWPRILEAIERWTPSIPPRKSFVDLRPSGSEE